MTSFAVVLIAAIVSVDSAAKLCDHEVVLDRDGRLMPWTTYDHVIRGTMEYIKNCPTHETQHGNAPWYLITSVINEDGNFKPNQNNQGSNVYWAVETVAKYYAYTGDRAAIDAVRLLLDRVLAYHTPSDWAWPRVPRTQDDTPDGEYTDPYSEPDKMCMVGYGYIRFYKLTGEEKYKNAAFDIARTVVPHIQEGNGEQSPLPFRVAVQTGRVIDGYTANMVAPVLFLDALMDLNFQEDDLSKKRAILWKWVLDYPMVNNHWSGYYEDVKSNHDNLNQQVPIETARYMMRRPDVCPDYRTQVPALIAWVRNRFGQTKRFGATSIREQDGCFREMSSHTSRYASVVAMWYGITGNANDREEARGSFALSTYSTFNKASQGDRALNYVGVGFVTPWFSDSYFDFLSHFFDGMAELPDMAPADQDHIIGSNSTITDVAYAAKRIEYGTFENKGNETLRITFKPKVSADGKPLDSHAWTYGEYRGVPGVLRISRENEKHILIEAAEE